MFEGDNDMEYIVRRLQSAAADPDMRYQMNAEDEFFSILEEKDTLIIFVIVFDMQDKDVSHDLLL